MIIIHNMISMYRALRNFHYFILEIRIQLKMSTYFYFC